MSVETIVNEDGSTELLLICGGIGKYRNNPAAVEAINEFVERSKKGPIYMGACSPRRKTGMSDEDFMESMRETPEDLVCAELTNVKMVNNRRDNSIMVVGDVKPHGKWAKMVETIQKGDGDCFFGVRGFVRRDQLRGDSLLNILTFDLCYKK